MAGTPSIANRIAPVAKTISASIPRAPRNGSDHDGRPSRKLPESSGGGDGGIRPGASAVVVVTAARVVVVFG